MNTPQTLPRLCAVLPLVIALTAAPLKPAHARSTPTVETPAQPHNLQRSEPVSPYGVTQPKSEDVALLLSIAVTLVGFTGVLFPLLFIGPSAGQLYAGATGYALRDIMLRVGAGAMFVVGVVLGMTEHHGPEPGGRRGTDGMGATVAIGGVILFGVSSISSILDGPARVRDYNQAIGLAPSWTLTPTLLGGVTREQRHETLPGVVFKATF